MLYTQTRHTTHTYAIHTRHNVYRCTDGQTHIYTIPTAKTNYITYDLPLLHLKTKGSNTGFHSTNPSFELWGAHSVGSGLLLAVKERKDCSTRKRRKRHVPMHPTIGGSQHFHWAKDQKRPLSRLDSQLRRPEIAKQIYNEDIRLQTQLTPSLPKSTWQLLCGYYLVYDVIGGAQQVETMKTQVLYRVSFHSFEFRGCLVGSFLFGWFLLLFYPFGIVHVFICLKDFILKIF